VWLGHDGGPTAGPLGDEREAGQPVASTMPHSGPGWMLCVLSMLSRQGFQGLVFDVADYLVLVGSPASPAAPRLSAVLSGALSSSISARDPLRRYAAGKVGCGSEVLGRLMLKNVLCWCRGTASRLPWYE